MELHIHLWKRDQPDGEDPEHLPYKWDSSPDPYNDTVGTGDGYDQIFITLPSVNEAEAYDLLSGATIEVRLPLGAIASYQTLEDGDGTGSCRVD